jgi:hypothetical protein
VNDDHARLVRSFVRRAIGRSGRTAGAPKLVRDLFRPHEVPGLLVP